MKKLIIILILVVFVTAPGRNANAQTYKFGHINSDDIIQTMPEFDSARITLENLRQYLTDYIETMSVELNNKYNSYMQGNKNLSEIVKHTKEQEINDLTRRIQEFQTNAQFQLQEKQAELFNPVYAKLEKAIKEAGEENDFIYIFDTSLGNLLYFDNSVSMDITSYVKMKLGIK